eukprot:442250_1
MTKYVAHFTPYSILTQIPIPHCTLIQVRLDDATQGVVKYIGEVQGKNGTMFGLEMLPYYGGHDTADTNGTIGDQVYFTCTDGEKLGRWVTDEDIEDVLDETNHDLELLGDAPKFTVG